MEYWLSGNATWRPLRWSALVAFIRNWYFSDACLNGGFVLRSMRQTPLDGINFPSLSNLLGQCRWLQAKVQGPQISGVVQRKRTYSIADEHVQLGRAQLVPQADDNVAPARPQLAPSGARRVVEQHEVAGVRAAVFTVQADATVVGLVELPNGIPRL